MCSFENSLGEYKICHVNVKNLQFRYYITLQSNIEVFNIEAVTNRVKSI